MADPHNPMDEEPHETWREAAAAWVPAVLAVILIRLFVFEPFRIPSGSMVPTLLIGDHVLVTKFSYGIWLPLKSIGIPGTRIGLPYDNVELVDLSDPQRGDVIVFHFPKDESVTYIKRVVALPGDRVRVVDNQLWINGEKQERETTGSFDDIDDQCQVRKAKGWTETLARNGEPPLRHGILTNLGRPGLLADFREVTVPPDTVFAMGDNRDHSQDSRAWGFVRYDQIKGKAHFVWLSWDGCAGSVGGLRFDRMGQSLYLEPPPAPTGGPTPAEASSGPT